MNATAGAHFNIIVEGMSCAACATRLERVLSNAEGVVEASVNFPLERARIYVNGPTVLNQIVETVRKAGFDVALETRQFKVEPQPDALAQKRLIAAISDIDGVAGVTFDPLSSRVEVKAVAQAVPLRSLKQAARLAGATLTQSDAEQAVGDRSQAKLDRLRRLTLVSVLLWLPFLLSMLLTIPGIAVIDGPLLPGFVQLALATPIQFVLGARFYRGAYSALRNGGANMDVLVVMGTTVAYLFSLYLLVTAPSGTERHFYFDASAAIITLVLVGKFMEAHANRGTVYEIRRLAGLRPAKALLRMSDGKIIERDVKSLKVGDVLVSRAGRSIAADGVVIEGRAEVDESALTGESIPAVKRKGDSVAAGSINIDGFLAIKTMAVGSETTLERMIRIVEEAQLVKPATQRLVDRVSQIFVPFVIACSALTLGLGHFFWDSPEMAILSAVSVLVIACPCALGLATPTALTVGSGAAARAGILVRDISALERAVRISHVVFDKTGTLTAGKPVLRSTESYSPAGKGRALEIAASLQKGSEHPIAAALRNAAQEQGIAELPVSGFRNLVAEGVEGLVDGVRHLLGKASLLESEGIKTPERSLEFGGTEIWLAAVEGQGRGLLARFEIVDMLRPRAAEAVRGLKEAGIVPLMLSGDSEIVVGKMAGEVGIDLYHANTRPEDKSRIIAELEEGGQGVAMVGDGINDAPALAQASLGIAMGSGTDVAMETAAITLVNPDPRLVGATIRIAQRTFAKIRQNLFWAFIYNVVALPAAAFGYLSPGVAAAAMALSSVSVVVNSLTLRMWKPGFKLPVEPR